MEKGKKHMVYYAVYRNRQKYCVVETRERAENVKRALIEKANTFQNKTNCFVNLSVSIREIVVDG